MRGELRRRCIGHAVEYPQEVLVGRRAEHLHECRPDAGGAGAEERHEAAAVAELQAPPVSVLEAAHVDLQQASGGLDGRRIVVQPSVRRQEQGNAGRAVEQPCWQLLRPVLIVAEVGEPPGDHVDGLPVDGPCRCAEEREADPREPVLEIDAQHAEDLAPQPGEERRRCPAQEHRRSPAGEQACA